ncbi:hypothetical protein [Lacticaseibacillus brantae]|uniref:Uncharacterized protein n=1 Tax=Lacticaseibacillus brantae DSM 23927 TaxID=1423727 RepID=A0A0R2B133_9LACO|nr:hypothetical protein [Lacticaseibacillus brantae]KRM73040.1 hypothetical protein FC34_GL000761 [Lacticaseibacillus brantae DSM 23927]
MKLTLEGTPDEIKKALQAMQGEERSTERKDGLLVYCPNDGLYLVRENQSDKLILQV